MTDAQTAATPAWVALARAASLLGPTQIQKAEAALGALPAAASGPMTEALNGIARLDPAVGAIAEAGRRLRLAQGTGAPIRPGGDPARNAFFLAAECVLHGLIAQVGQRVAQTTAPEAAAATLLRAVREDLAVFPRGSAPGTVLPAGLERELRLSLGPALYLAVAAAPKQG